jgi:pimeloyl-ACP methyl ester carboxylesterase
MHPIFNAAVAAIALALPAFSLSAAAQERFTATVSGPADAPDVILIPGLASSGAVWDATVEQLNATHRVHVLHARGFAGEAAGANADGPVLQALIEEIAAYAAALDNPALIGHSVGGLISLEAAAARPDEIGRIMVVDALPFYSLLFNPAATAELSAPYAETSRAQMLAMNDAQFASMQTQTMTMMTRNEAARPMLLDWSMTSDRRVVAQVMYEVMLRDARPRLPAITTPTTVMFPFDSTRPAASAQTDALYAGAYADLANVDLRPMDQTYHFMMLDQPAAFAAEVAIFLR